MGGWPARPPGDSIVAKRGSFRQDPKPPNLANAQSILAAGPGNRGADILAHGGRPGHERHAPHLAAPRLPVPAGDKTRWPARRRERTIGAMAPGDDYLALDDDALLSQSDVHAYRASGPGGQHRNKVSSAVRIRHRPTGVTATASDSRLQQDNRRLALRRLRAHIACRVRRPIDTARLRPPPAVIECLCENRARQAPAKRRLRIGRKDARFWPAAAFLLDLLSATAGRLAAAAALLGISTSNLVAVLKSDRHLLAAAQAIRKEHGRGPLT